MELLPKILLISLIAGLFTQFLKIIIKGIRAGKFKATYIDDYGGMPSAHTAFLTALLSAIGIYEGINSTSFAVAFVIAAILIRDAVGIRMELEKQGRIIKKILNNGENNFNVKDELADRMGHTYPEVIIGGIIGVLITTVFYFIF